MGRTADNALITSIYIYLVLDLGYAVPTPPARVEAARAGVQLIDRAAGLLPPHTFHVEEHTEGL